MINPQLHHDIRRVIDAIRFISETSYSINGLKRDIETIRIKDPLGSLNGATTGAGKLKEKFIAVLLTDIYNNLYTADHSAPPTLGSYLHNEFITEVSEGNNGTGSWEEGWTLIGPSKRTGKLIVRKNNMKFWVEEERVRAENSTGAETTYSVKVEKETRFLNSHFYYAYGDTHKTEVTGYADRPLRFYWNLTPQGAINYIASLTRELNKRKIAFRTKILSSPADYSRTDSGVLYIDSSQLESVLPAIEAVYADLRPLLKSSVPLFVKQVYPGVGFAEDPRNGMSFGISRSSLIGNTLFSCFEKQITDPQMIEGEMVCSFIQAGISTSHPYAQVTKINEYESILQKLNPSWN